MAIKKQRKAEARLKRKIEKQAKNTKKNVRLVNSVSLPDRTIRSAIPDISKLPRIVEASSYKQLYFEWNVIRADIEGCWSWGEQRCWSVEEYTKFIETHFNAQCNNTWQQVETQTYNGAGGKRKRSNKYQPVDSLDKEAQDRWMENDVLAQFEHMFRCRLGTNRRVWGIRYTNHYFIIWYERHHKICPVDEND